MSWNSTLALLWTRTVGPSRPTVSELAIYTKYAHKLLNNSKNRLKILILGSTPEFRDWAFEENMETTIIDYSADYNKTISREIRHKSIIEGTQRKRSFCKQTMAGNGV